MRRWVSVAVNSTYPSAETMALVDTAPASQALVVAVLLRLLPLAAVPIRLVQATGSVVDANAGPAKIAAADTTIGSRRAAARLARALAAADARRAVTGSRDVSVP